MKAATFVTRCRGQCRFSILLDFLCVYVCMHVGECMDACMHVCLSYAFSNDSPDYYKNPHRVGLKMTVACRSCLGPTLWQPF